MQRTNFSPLQHGFKFAKPFVNDLAEVPGFGKIEAAGRCGGVSYTALDFFLNDIPVPAAFNALSFLPGNVHTIPQGSLARLPDLPMDGDLTPIPDGGPIA